MRRVSALLRFFWGMSAYTFCGFSLCASLVSLRRVSNVFCSSIDQARPFCYLTDGYFSSRSCIPTESSGSDRGMSLRVLFVVSLRVRLVSVVVFCSSIDQARPF